ncbi:MAG: CCC motif membrane protein [Flavobacteriales bacterium]
MLDQPSGINPVPNSTAVLVLGIISIPTCFCLGLVGLACGIIALVLAAKGTTAYTENPDMYTQSSYNNLKAGKICAIVGTCLSALYLVYIIFYFIFVGTVAFSFLELMKNAH